MVAAILGGVVLPENPLFIVRPYSLSYYWYDLARFE